MTALHLRRLYVDRDCLILYLGPVDKRHDRLLGIHVEFPWSECVRKFHAPYRLYIHGYFFSATLGAKSQAWSPRTGYRERKWRHFAIALDRRFLCNAEFPNTFRYGGPVARCARVRRHRGEHA